MALSDEKVQIAISILRTQKELLKEYATAHHWSMSQAASLLIAEGLDQWLEEQTANQRETEAPPTTRSPKSSQKKSGK